MSPSNTMNPSTATNLNHAAPPSPQEVSRKLSMHSKPVKKRDVSTAPVPLSGTESDSDSVVVLPQDMGLYSSVHHLSSSPPTTSMNTSASATIASGSGSGSGLGSGLGIGIGHGVGMGSGGSGSGSMPLSSIAERRSEARSDESDEDDEEEDGGDEGRWGTEYVEGKVRKRSGECESVIKAGYLSKKGERRKTWKKRWFVLRSAHLAYYKTAAEYQLLRLLDLAEVHTCTSVELKKHAHTFALVCPARTYYLQAESAREAEEWVGAIGEAREAVLATQTQTSLTGAAMGMGTATPPIPIPGAGVGVGVGVGAGSAQGQGTPSPPNQRHQAFASSASDSEDASPNASPQKRAVAYSRVGSTSTSKGQTATMGQTDPSKVVLSGYLMKCGSKRRNWRKRWFILTGERLIYSGSHMDTKPHRQMELSQIVDALEVDLPASRNHLGSPNLSSPAVGVGEEGEGGGSPHVFKIITTKRTLVVCAPSEEEEIRWLSAVRALIARRTGPGMGMGTGTGTGQTPGSGGSGVKASTSEGHVQGGSGSGGSGMKGTKGWVGRRRSVSGGAGGIGAGVVVDGDNVM